MERAVVKRLYRDESSRETVMLMESTHTKERIKIMVPCQRAGILALEAHGLNDRCPLYSMFARCVGELGAVFGVVVISCEETQPTSGAISGLARRSHHLGGRRCRGVGGVRAARTNSHLPGQVG